MDSAADGTWPPRGRSWCTPKIKIEILDVQPSEAERFKKLAVQVRFLVSGSKSQRETLAAARTPFWIHVHTADLMSGTMNCVASQPGKLEPGQFEYNPVLKFPIPEVARYQLQTLVLLLPPVGAMALCEGPAFQAVP